MKKKIQISIDEELLNDLDKEIGMIPRSRYINELIKKDIKEKKDKKK